jgi:hypothetical protein
MLWIQPMQAPERRQIKAWCIAKDTGRRGRFDILGGARFDTPFRPRIEKRITAGTHRRVNALGAQTFCEHLPLLPRAYFKVFRRSREL